MRDESSVTSDGLPVRAVRCIFVGTWLLLLVFKLLLAAALAPFGDEAFYWQESQRLAFSYADVPAATAWLIRAGEVVLGHGELGMRLGFVVLGSAIPWLVVRFGARIGGEATGWMAGTLWLLLPLGGTLGLLALPDVPLTFAAVLALVALERLARTRALRDGALLGLALALAWFSHYRAAMLCLAGLAFLILAPRGRVLWRSSALWLAFGVALLGLVPLAVFNAGHAWSGLAFQFVERHPWRFHVDAFVQPVEQALVCTPLLYMLLLWAIAQSWHRRDTAPWDVLAVAAIVPVVGYFALGLFADDLRFRAHWPLIGYAPAVVALALLRAQGRVSKAWATATVSIALLGLGVTFGYFMLAASSRATSWLVSIKAFPENFVGWREAGDATRKLLAETPEALLVADHFLLAAELDFQFGGERLVYALDHPLNRKHGRAPQLALWRLDESGLNEHAGAPVVLVVEDTAGRERERAAWQATFACRIAELAPADSVALFGGRKRFTIYLGRVPERPTTCPLEDKPSTQLIPQTRNKDRVQG